MSELCLEEEHSSGGRTFQEHPGRLKEQLRVRSVLLEWNRQWRKKQGVKLEGQGAESREQSVHGFKRILGGDLLLKIPMEGYSAEE